jgi:predicted nucleic acid-binding protein
MRIGLVIPLDADLAIAAARLARRHSLPTADSIIYATALAQRATVWTQDDDLADLANVRYFAKVKPA